MAGVAELVDKDVTDKLRRQEQELVIDTDVSTCRATCPDRDLAAHRGLDVRQLVREAQAFEHWDEPGIGPLPEPGAQ